MQIALEKVRKEAERLMPGEQLKLVEVLVRRLRVKEKGFSKGVELGEFYGVRRGLWKEDAQEYVSRLRENRDLPKKSLVDAVQSGALIAFSSVVTLTEVLPKPI